MSDFYRELKPYMNKRDRMKKIQMQMRVQNRPSKRGILKET